MKYKLHKQITEDDGFKIVNLLSSENLERINFLLEAIGEPIHSRLKTSAKVILPEEAEFKFYDTMMKKNQTI
ncbi:MAG: hypothetical protein M1308_24175 [Actinobacteria bacterium]|nr:hypothetical protein [Actinomycetota bacterium]